MSTPSTALLLLMLFLNVTVLCAVTPEGFLSIDCGTNQGPYLDPQTNLTWVPDAPFLLAGSNGEVPQSLQHTLDPSLGNFEALKSFRYFPVHRRKYCYELPLNPNTTFFIRAMFLHGNSPVLERSTRFQIFFNYSLWLQVQYGMNNHDDFNFLQPEVREGMYISDGANRINLCLVPQTGIPFISSLELREMDSTFYAPAREDNLWGRSLLLSNVVRWNVAPAGSPNLRYPSDQYDRVWSSSLPQYTDASLNRTYHIFEDSLKISNNLPIEAAEYALQFSDSVTVKYPLIPLRSVLACFVFYVQAKLNGVSRLNLALSIFKGSYTTSPTATYTITNQTTVIYVFDVWAPIPEMNYTEFSIYNENDGSESIVELLAMEIYTQDEFVSGQSFDYSGGFINFMKRNFNMASWQGDVCIPRANDWLTCNDDNIDFFVDSMSLSDLSDSAKLGNTSLMSASDLWDVLYELKSCSITYSNLEDDTLFHLLVYNSALNLTFLNLSHNNISSRFFSNNTWSDFQYYKASVFKSIAFLDLSYNHLNKELLHTDLQSFLFQGYGGQLQVLNISNNVIEDDIPPTFLEPFFHSTVFEKLFADDNSITGTLNITIWYTKVNTIFQESIKEATINNNEHIFQQVFSFVNNSISNIIPSMKELENMDANFLIQQFNKSEGGLLLGNNPICNKAKSLLHRFLCRVSIDDMSYALPKKKPSKLLIYIGTFGGSVTLFAGTIALIIIWRLLKQVKILRSFQQELSNRMVQPPFFSYRDLKFATNDFHEENKLGSGAFGAVYKGTLQDKREVAVKKLFRSTEESTVLNDFLNEVVLLTGIKHKNLVQLLGCCINDKERILVYEFAEKGNVADALWGKTSQLEGAILSWKERLNICMGTAWGLSYLHKELQPGIIHRDIKAANVLIDRNLNAKIADFGLAKSFTEDETHADFTVFAGTRGYLAPEYVLDGILTDKADVYSFGILALEIISGRKCVDQTQPEDRVLLKDWAEILQRQEKLLELLPPTLEGNYPVEEVIRVIKIALLCVRPKARHRPTMTQVALMLTGTVDDFNSISLSKKQQSFDDASSRLGSEGDFQRLWRSSLLSEYGESSMFSTSVMCGGEGDSLINPRDMQSSFSSFSTMGGQSTGGGPTTTFQDSVATFSQSLSRKLKQSLSKKTKLGPDQMDSL